MLDYNKLYYFTESSLPSVISLKDASDTYEEYLKDWRRGINKPNFKPKLKIADGRFFLELSRHQETLLICNDKFLQILTANNLTGWDYIPVEIYLKDNTLLNNYNIFCTTGKCGNADFSRAYKGKKNDKYQYWYGEYFIDDYHDGSDFVTAEGICIYCSEKAKQAILDAQINCANFECLETARLYYVPKNIEELIQQRNK